MIKILASISMALIIFNGCVATTGNEILGEMDTREIKEQIVKERSSKYDVRKLLGEPDLIDLDQNGHEKWTYTHIQKDTTSFMPVVNIFVIRLSGYKKSVVILFDKKDIVKEYVSYEAECKEQCKLF